MDKGTQPTPETTLVVLLGASEWPRWTDLDASNAFSQSAQGVINYFLNTFHLPQANLLNLFDADKSADDIDNIVDQFLHRRIKGTKKPYQNIRDVLVFFIGHAGFVEGSLDYYFALRRTRKNNPELSGLQVASFARTLRKHTRDLRLMLILDCCYAAAAFKAFHFQGGRLEEAANIQIYEAFKDSHQQNHVPSLSHPRKGIALLCSSSSSRPSLLDTHSTEFIEALLQSLDTGSVDEPGNLPLRTVGSLVQKSLREKGKTSHPELHSPDQREGDIAAVPFFPNLQTRLPVLPSRVPLRLDHRSKALIILLCLMLLLSGGGSATWLLLAQQQQRVVSTQYATATAVAFAPLATAATKAYWSEANRNGVQFGFDAAHTHWNPYEQILSASNITRVKQLWSFAIGGAISSSPAVAGGMIYVGSDNGEFYAFNATCRQNCQPLWSFNTGKSVASSPAVAGGMVYVGSANGKLYAFDATCHQNCQPLWSFNTGQPVYSSPTVADGMVYIGSLNNAFYAFSARCSHACQPLWSFQTGTQIISSSPAVANGMVYLAANDGKLYTFDATCRRSCQPLWSFYIGTADSSPAVADGIVYVASYPDQFYAFRATCHHNCQPLWSFMTRGPIYSSPAVANGFVYLGADDNGKLYVFDAACRQNCRPLWSFTTGAPIDSSPTVANGVVYVGSQNGKLYAFDATCRRNCQPLWSFATGGALYSSPAVANGVIYIGSDDGKLYAFGLHAAS